MKLKFTANSIETHQYNGWVYGLTMNNDGDEFLHIGREAFRGDTPCVSVWYKSEEHLNDNCIERIGLFNDSVRITLSKFLPGLEDVEGFEINLNATVEEIHQLKIALRSILPNLLDENLVDV